MTKPKRKVARKRAAKSSPIEPTAFVLQPGHALMLRTCDAQMRAHGGFVWPKSGPVSAPDWTPEPRCGGGLHGLLWGAGDGALVSWDASARWLVVDVVLADIVNLDGKVKVPRGEVVLVGDRLAAAALVAQHAPPDTTIVGGTATAGDRGTATAGYGGTATAGYGGTATAGDRGTATAGYGGTATAGDRGTATAGDGGTISVRWWDGDASRYRIVSADVGENGIEPGVGYRVEDKRLVRAKPPAGGESR